MVSVAGEWMVEESKPGSSAMCLFLVGFRVLSAAEVPLLYLSLS